MSVDLTKYNTCAKICGEVFQFIKNSVLSGEILDVKQLQTLGDNMIINKCEQIYKREKNKGIAFPVSISLNNCVGYYLYEKNNDDYNIIKNGDVVKVELAVNISGCIAVLGETFIYKCISGQKDYINFLNTLQKDIVNMMIHGQTNDDVKMYIESKCTESKCFPVENTISYQHLDGQLNTSESKSIITNYVDKNDEMVINNLCYSFEENEVYTINLTIIENNDEQTDETEHSYLELHDSHIYRFNEFYYNLKLKSSREFCSNMKNKYNTNAFNGIEYKNNIRSRIGIKESLQGGILKKYSIYYSKDKYPVYHKKFTVIVGKNKGTLLKY